MRDGKDKLLTFPIFIISDPSKKFALVGNISLLHARNLIILKSRNWYIKHKITENGLLS